MTGGGANFLPLWAFPTVAERGMFSPHPDEKFFEEEQAMTEKTIPKPPANLKKAGRAFWVDRVTEYDHEGHQLVLLARLCEEIDHNADLEAAISKHGLTFEDRFGQVKERPEADMASKSKNMIRLLTRELGYDLEKPADMRPPRRDGQP
jgi:phage terminase small subunit